MNNKFRMRKKFIIVFLVVALVFGTAAHAVVFAFAPYVASVVESFVIRSAARQVVSVVGTAANDASWASTFLSWMNATRSIASIVINASGGVTYEIATAPEYQPDLTYAPIFAGYGQIHDLSPDFTISGLAVSVPATIRGTDANVVAANFIAWANPLLLPRYQMTLLDVCVFYSLTFACPILYADGWDSNIVGYHLDIEQTDNIKRIVNFVPDSSDPDWTAEEIILHASDGAMRFEGITANSVLDFSSSTSGLVFEYQEQISPSQVRKLVGNTDINYIPVSVSSSTYDGVITDPSSGAAGGTAAIEFPSDYARTGEAQTAANTLAPKIDRIGDALTNSSTLADPVEPVAADMPGYGSAFTGLLSWQLPQHSSTCPAMLFDLSVISPSWNNLVMDSHCSLIQGKTQEFAAAMALVWALLALSIVLRA